MKVWTDVFKHITSIFVHPLFIWSYEGLGWIDIAETCCWFWILKDKCCVRLPDQSHVWLISGNSNRYWREVLLATGITSRHLRDKSRITASWRGQRNTWRSRHMAAHSSESLAVYVGQEYKYTAIVLDVCCFVAEYGATFLLFLTMWRNNADFVFLVAFLCCYPFYSLCDFNAA